MPKTSKTAIGLDIGHQAIKVVVATANGQALRVRRMERIPLPLDGSDVAQTLQRWWEEENLGKYPVVTQIGGSQVLYQYLEMEPEDPREPEQVGRMEALRFGEMTDSQMEVSTSPISKNPKERRLLLTMARPHQLETALGSCQQAGLNLVNAVPAPIALYNGVVALGEPVHQLTLFADLGSTRTEVSIADGQGVLFARSFAMGTLQLTQALAGRERTSLQQAERMRIQAASFEALPESMHEVCNQFVRQWHQEITACVHMFKESAGRSQPQAKISRILLSGGGTAWKPLEAALRSAAEIPLSLVGRINGHEQVDSRDYMIAAGLAADALGISRTPSSLLTAGLRQRLNRQRNKQYWMVTGVFAVATVAMVAATTQVAFSRESQTLQQKNTTLQRSELIRKESEEIVAKKLHLEQMMLPLADVVQNSARIRDLTLFIAREKSNSDFITFLGDSESYLQLRLDEQSQTEEGSRRMRSPLQELQKDEMARLQAESMRDAKMNRLIIEGFTSRENLSTVKALIEKLKTPPAVQRADLLSDDLIFADPERDKQWSRGRFQRFVLEVKLVQSSVTATEVQP
jgi:Tfp pilus assembly PilM family ATPase